MSATLTEVRSWARENGHTVKERGKMSAAVMAAYNDAHPGAEYEPADSYPDPDFDTAFADVAETAPRRPPRTAGARKGWFGLGGRDKGKGGKKDKRPRVSVEDLLSAAWRGLAGAAKPIPPVYRVLRVQAPVAGMLLEDAVKDSAVDALLQPFARLAQTGTAIQALVGPPLFTAAISMHTAQCTAAGATPNPLFMHVATDCLRSSLMAWLDVAGPKFEQAMRREKEFEEHYGQSVDDMMAWMFSASADHETEEANIRYAQGIRDDQPAAA
jgi:Lsr2 protein